MTRISGFGRPLLGALLALFTTPPALNAADDYSTGFETWKFDGKAELSTADWPLQSLLKMTMRVLSPEEAKKTLPWDDKKEEAKKENERQKTAPKDAPKDKKKPARSTVPLPELEYKSDRLISGIGTITPGKGEAAQDIHLGMSRSVRFDPQRRAIRILDVVTNNSDYNLPFEATFTTAWQPEIVPKLAQYRYLDKHSQTPGGVLVTAVSDPQLPVLMFIFGNHSKGWKRVDNLGSKDALSWTYTGWIDPGQRVVILHWLALIDDVRTATLRTTRAALIRDGMPNDDSLNDQVFKELINFPMADESQPLDEQRPHELPLVKALAEDFGIEPDRESDQLVLGGMSPLKGEFTVNNLRLHAPGADRILALKDLAAIQGGAATGRKARVYFRDGSIVSGTLSWEEGVFKSASIGTITLTPEGLDTLILRDDATSDPPPRFIALCVAPNGDVHRLAELPQDALQLRWAAGRLDIPWSRIVSIRRLEAPDLEQEVFLKDGSRIRGWSQISLGDSAPGACLAYATTWPDLMAALADQPPPPAQNLRRLQTSDLSLVVGDWGQEELSVVTASGPVRLRVADIRTVKIQTHLQDRPLSLEITTATGSVLRGAAASDTLAWRLGDQSLNIPWTSIAEITNPPPAQP